MKIRQILGQPELSQMPEQASPQFCLPKCRIGLEYEVENSLKYRHDRENQPLAARNLQTYFTSHNDGSLRDNGVEFVFHGPYYGTKILDATAAMEEAFRVFEFKGSYRTSMHVHMDMQDMNFPGDVEKLGGIYCVVEPFLYRFVGSNRDQCNYSLPWYVHSTPYEAYFQTINKYDLTDSRHTGSYGVAHGLRAQKGNKYSGLNFFSLGDFGTVEFRHAPVTMQRDKILTWINILMRIKKWVSEKPKAPEALITYAQKMGPELLLQEVFEEQSKDVTRMSKDVVSDFQLGLATLYQYVASI
jgi:hypothetical protein